MDESWREPFSKAEMESIRKALGDKSGSDKSWGEKTLGDENRVLADALALALKFARSLPFSEDVLAAYHCVRDPATSARVKFTLLAALAYFVMPLDAVPDILPFLGFGDDAAVLAAAIASVRGAIRSEHRDKARATLDAVGQHVENGRGASA